MNVDVLDRLRPEVLGHCYRMLGSIVEAEDAAQDTMVRAVRGLPGFEGRAALRTWVFRIATNVCLDALAKRKKRRERPMAFAPGTLEGPFDPTPAEDWIEPVPDAWVVPRDASPEAVVNLRRSIRLAFVTALQLLSARERAALLLADVVGFSAAETAEALALTTAAVNSALQRARARLADVEGPVEPTPADTEVVERYARAFERFDLDGLVQLLSDDVAFQMPPIPLWLRGSSDVHAFLAGPGRECRGSVLVPVAASGGFAFAQYRHGGSTPWGIVTLEVRGGQVVGIDTFLDVDTLFPRFGLPDRWVGEKSVPPAMSSGAVDGL